MILFTIFETAEQQDTDLSFKNILLASDTMDAVMVYLTLPDERFTVALQNQSSSQFAALNKTLIEALSSALVGFDNTLVRYVDSSLSAQISESITPFITDEAAFRFHRNFVLVTEREVDGK